jgi:hypothetical protein
MTITQFIVASFFIYKSALSATPYRHSGGANRRIQLGHAGAARR